MEGRGVSDPILGGLLLAALCFGPVIWLGITAWRRDAVAIKTRR